MRSDKRHQRDGHIPVHWLNDSFPPTRWERLNSKWINLPGALVLGLIVLAIVLPRPSISPPDMPSLDVPDVSMPVLAGEHDRQQRDRATPPPAASPVATPAREAMAPRTQGMVTPTPTPQPEIDPADVEANELGRVPIVMYHAFVHNMEYTDEWTLTFDQFRAQLDWFRENDFVMVGMQSMVDGRFDLPAGKKPVILTFDDASAGQFGLQVGPDGEYEVRPDTAVGVLEAYRQEYPEFHGPAMFAVLPFNCFASENDPSSCQERLDWLVDNGYEIANHTADHVDLTEVEPEFLTRSIGAMELWINERIPRGEGNLSNVLVLPFGAYPQDPMQRGWLADGFWYLGEPVNLEIVLAVNGGPAISPYSTKFHPVETYRIASDLGILAYWQQQMLSGESIVFVSDGDPETVTVPASWVRTVDQDKLERKGLKLQTWDDE